MLWEGRCDSPKVAVSCTTTWWQEFVRLNANHPSHDVVNLSPSRWTTPRLGQLKLNFSGAWNRDSLIGGVGVIVREGNGNLW
ncbi:hypothetical protein ACFX13_031735 [Malus domestica]